MHSIASFELFLFCGVVLAIIVFLRRINRRPRRAQPAAPRSARPTATTSRLPYTRQQHLLTRAERDFFAVLQTAVPSGWYIFPQVRLANVVQVAHATRGWQTHFNRIQAKCVDFVLCDPQSISPQLVIELDDSSHNAPDRQARDAFVDAALASAGLPILHVRWQATYDRYELAQRIREQTSIDYQPTYRAPVPHTANSAAAAPAAIRWACRQCQGEVSASAIYCNHCGALLSLDQ